MDTLLLTKQSMDLCKVARSSHVLLCNQLFLIDRGHFSECKNAEKFVCFFVLDKMHLFYF